MHIDTEETDRIIQKIYEAANNPEVWESIGNDIATLVNGGTVHMMLVSKDGSTEYISQFLRGDPGFASEYIQDYAAIDFRLPRVVAKRPGRFVEERSYVSRDEARNSIIHQDLLPRYEIYDIVGANMSIDDCLGWFGISTRSPYHDFSDADKASLARLTPHILQSYKTFKANQDLRLSRDLSFAALDVVDAGLFLFRRGRMIHCNATAERLLDEGFFIPRDGRLRCTDPAQNSRLSAFLQLAFTTGDGALLVEDFGGARTYAVKVHAPAPHFSSGVLQRGSDLIISIVSLQSTDDPHEREVVLFCALYRLSPAEGAVVRAVLGLSSLRDFAADRGVALDTVQKQLKSAMVKMGLNSQKELVQLFERFRILQDGDRSAAP